MRKVNRIALCTCMCILLMLPGQAQSDTCIHRQRIYKSGLFLSGGGSLGALATLWYSDQSRRSFHWYDDSGDWLQMDKAGHASGAYMLSEIVKQSASWACYDDRASRRQALYFPLAYMSLIEVMDGFSSGYGASWADLGSNTAGALLFHFQDKAWGEQRIRLKWSFHSSEYAVYRPELMGDGWYEEMLKDYNGQTYWLSANLNSLGLGESLPRWLNLAVGYGAEGMIGGSNNTDWQAGNEMIFNPQRYRQFYLSPDIDLSRIENVPPWLKKTFSVLNILKVPLPTLSYSKEKGVGFHPLYF